MGTTPRSSENMSESAIPSIEEYRNEVPEKAIGMYDYLISQNCKPSVAAASSTYLCGVATTDPKSPQWAVAEYFDVSTGSIGKWYQVLLDNGDEWEFSTDPYTKSELLKQLPGDRKKGSPDGGLTKQDLIEKMRERLSTEERRSETNVTWHDLKELTGKEDPLRQKEVLEETFGFGFGPEEDANVRIQINKSGVRKILKQLNKR